MHIARHIYNTKGMQGFYVGSTPNLLRVVVKNIYRYPLMIGLPAVFNKTLPSQYKENKMF